MTSDGNSRRRFVLACGCVATAAWRPGAALARQPAPAGAAGAVPPPPGWSYLPELGVRNIFSLVPGESREPSPQIQVRTRRDVGILVKPAEFELTPTTTLRWMWNVKRLPSQVAEDVTPGHDYLSIAVKFDNGQDLTYMFSSALPVGTGFRCPLRNWKDRETHVVVRSGQTDLGRWLREERTVLPDYLKYVGADAPKRITEVWLIANSSIQRTEGDANFASISLGARRGRLQVL